MHVGKVRNNQQEASGRRDKGPPAKTMLPRSGLEQGALSNQAARISTASSDFSHEALLDL